MIFREMKFGSGDYRKACELRNAELRVPIGMNLYDEDLAAECQQLHFGWFGECGELVACVIAVPMAEGVAKIRQMAVRREHQGHGHGRRIIREMEQHLARLGFVHLAMHARMTAVDFYSKLGYAMVGTEFMEVGIPHLKMEKAIP